MMNVSVVVPTLNEEDNIPNLFHNLNYQLSDGDEVIIVDGGSNDDTVPLSEEWGANTIVSESSSIGEARNIGTKNSNNEVVLSLDADSIPPKGYINRVRTHFERDEELAVLWGSVVDKNGVPIRSMVAKFSTIFGGASGNGTSFRKSHFDELSNKYPDINFMEDVAIIYRLSRVGKAKRDKNLIMVMDMDRRRYQTVPILAGSAISYVAGISMGGGTGNILKGIGTGLAGTELTYESMSNTPFHHDQVGVALSAIGRISNSRLSDQVVGTGLGMVAHHDMTEGISALPTELQKHTDVIVDKQ